MGSLTQTLDMDIQVDQLIAHYGDLTLGSDDEEELSDHFMQERQPTNSPEDLIEHLLFGEEDVMILRKRNQSTINSYYQDFHIN